MCQCPAIPLQRHSCYLNIHSLAKDNLILLFKMKQITQVGQKLFEEPRVWQVRQSSERQQMQISVPLNKKGIVLNSKAQDKKKKKKKAKATAPLSMFYLAQGPTGNFKENRKISDETIPHGESFQKFVYGEQRKSELSSQQERLRKGFRWITDAEKTLIMVLRMYIMYMKRGRNIQIATISHIALSSESFPK